VTELVKYKKEGQIVTIMLANPPVNAVSTKVLNALNAAFDRAEAEDDARVIIFAARGRRPSAPAATCVRRRTSGIRKPPAPSARSAATRSTASRTASCR